jgi:hypothetical protein
MLKGLLHQRAQEVAGNHGVALWGRTEEGFATDPIMVANNLIFVATRIQIQMDSYPKWCAFCQHPVPFHDGQQPDLRRSSASRSRWNSYPTR